MRLLLARVLFVLYVFSRSTSSALSVFSGAKKTATKSNVQQLLEAVSRPQTFGNRRIVESLATDLTNQANSNSRLYKKPIAAGAYRTVWTSVTAASPIGILKRDKPSCVLGGKRCVYYAIILCYYTMLCTILLTLPSPLVSHSWQLIDKNLRYSENIVFWPFFNLRMAGLARISPKSGVVGYDLAISGLEFRRSKANEEPIPEQYGKMGDAVGGKVTKVLTLGPEETLSNGVGTLEVCYNDGSCRITVDAVQNNMYIHIKEPVAPSVLALID